MMLSRHEAVYDIDYVEELESEVERLKLELERQKNIVKIMAERLSQQEGK
jgi:hypothetical protein